MILASARERAEPVAAFQGLFAKIRAGARALSANWPAPAHDKRHTARQPRLLSAHHNCCFPSVLASCDSMRVVISCAARPRWPRKGDAAASQ